MTRVHVDAEIDLEYDVSPGELATALVRQVGLETALLTVRKAAAEVKQRRGLLAPGGGSDIDVEEARREVGREMIAELRSLLFRKDVIGALSLLERITPSEPDVEIGVAHMLERGHA